MGNLFNRNGSIGFLDTLTLIFITLKLLGEITWSWWWVLAPTWGFLTIMIPLALVVVFIQKQMK